MEAHEALYEQFGGPVYTLARRLVRRAAVADELLQDTFVEVIEKIGALRDEGAVGAWIRSIAVSQCLMYLRSTKNREVLEPTLERYSDSMSVEMPAELEKDLERALGQLPDMTRAVVWLHEVEGYTHSEIALLLGKTASFSKSQLARALTRLREAVTEDREVESCIRVSRI